MDFSLLRESFTYRHGRPENYGFNNFNDVGGLMEALHGLRFDDRRSTNKSRNSSTKKSARKTRGISRGTLSQTSRGGGVSS